MQSLHWRHKGDDAMGASDRCVPQVHHLQVALNEHGYYCGEDETVWWQFGMDTYSSLLTFQVALLALQSYLGVKPICSTPNACIRAYVI